MPRYSNVNGVMREVAPRVNVNGAWRDVDKGYSNVNGVWRPEFESDNRYFDVTAAYHTKYYAFDGIKFRALVGETGGQSYLYYMLQPPQSWLSDVPVTMEIDWECTQAPTSNWVRMSIGSYDQDYGGVDNSITYMSTFNRRTNVLSDVTAGRYLGVEIRNESSGTNIVVAIYGIKVNGKQIVLH